MRFASGAKFALLSFLCVMVFALSMGFALSSLLTRAVQEWEWENTAALVRREVGLRGIDTILATPRHAPLDEGTRQHFARLMQGLPEVVRVKVWDRDATVVWSDEPRLIGQRFAEDDELKIDLYEEIARRQPGFERRVVFVTGDNLNPITKHFLDRTGAVKVGKPFAVDAIRRLVPLHASLPNGAESEIAPRS